jgi:purine-binding chemotaxis protein CheW
MNTKELTKSEGSGEVEISNIDFKMVTFTLGGKDYGIDIMKVKEINKAQKFTFVPNSAPFVKGVYNMRGDIISVIDLRVFFNLPVPREDKGYENMIILRLEDNTIGILVDTIEKVIGIDSSRKQPPHPLFGDINIKYIDGVVENDSSLYIILDVEKIFSIDSRGDAAEKAPVKAAAQVLPDIREEAFAAPAALSDKSLNISFIEETLPTYINFHPSAVNRDWITSRYDSWEKEKGEGNTQLNSKEDAREFLRGFHSACTGQLWSDGLIDALEPLLPELRGNAFIWNPGCGRGFETYSIAAMLKKRNPDALIKVQGNDNDLISISSAPGLNIDRQRVSSFYEPFLVDGAGGTQFNQTVKDSVMFEYSDLSNLSSLPRMDMVLCRDTVSYLPGELQEKLFNNIYEQLKPGGLLMLGDNERPITDSGWQLVENNGVKLYKKV